MTGVVGVVGVLGSGGGGGGDAKRSIRKNAKLRPAASVALGALDATVQTWPPPGRASIVGAFNYQLLASGFPPDVAWLSFQKGYCTVRRISFGPMSLTSEYMVF